MKKMQLSLEYCRGINKLDYTFDFDTNDYIIYAINGSMKTSLYKTISDYKEGLETRDEFFPLRKTKRNILDENNNDININSIVLVGNEDYSIEADKITSLLVNDALKKEYDKIFSSLDKNYSNLSKKIKSFSGETIETMLNDIGVENVLNIDNSYYDSEGTIDFKELKYNKIFSEDNLKILKQEIITNAIDDYISVCNEIISENEIFIKDVFELYNLKTIKKALDSNNYFTPGHLLKMKMSRNEDKYFEYQEEDVNNIISKLESQMKEDNRIAAVNLALTDKIKSQELNTFLSQNQWIIPLLDDLDKLKRGYWKYLINNKEVKDLINNYIDLYNEKKTELESIIKESNKEENFKKWNEAIDVFNNKFINMPFKLSVGNITDIILKDQACSLIYEFTDSSGKNSDVKENVLKENLSNGERKAFNILNLIFEIQYRINNNIESIIIVDDIADSFDYKNKYAIIEFLKELNENKQFHLIILTHNFDFYRTCSNRLSLNRLTVLKDNKINFIDFAFNKNIFNYFKNNINKEVFFLASIPFVRNLIELSRDDNDTNYRKLTDTLHYKQDTSNTTTNDIANIYLNEINKSITINNQLYTDLLFKTADNFKYGNTKVELENKLVLSMAIRIKFEMKLFSKINNWSIINGITSNQTYELIKHCKANNLLTTAEIKIAEKVVIMTSENIHVNAFMYEPVIDMSDDELINLYNEVKNM